MTLRALLIMEEEKCGGAALSFFALCRALSVRCEVHLALHRATAEDPALRRQCDALDDAGVRIYRFATPLNPGTFANLHRSLRQSAARQLAALIETSRPDAVVVNLPTVERGQAVLDAVELSRARFRVWGFLHLSQPPSMIGAKLGRIRDLMVPRLIRRFDRLMTVSHASAREISERYGIEPPQVVYPPTETLEPLKNEADRATLRKAEGLPNTFLMGVVGRIQVHHKGHDVALRLTRRLLHQNAAPHLVIIGDGPDRQVIRRMSERLGIAQAITFLGWRNDVANLIPLLDTVVIPSRYEGFPQVAVQAVTAHVPVVAYAVGGLTELIPPRFSVRYGDEEGLVAAVGRLLSGNDLWPAAEVAHRARACCDPQQVADRVLALLS